jgi:hypothetical protein
MLLLQSYFFLPAAAPSRGPVTDANPVVTEPHRFPMAGFLGGVFVILGPVIYFAARRRDGLPTLNAVK